MNGKLKVFETCQNMTKQWSHKEDFIKEQTERGASRKLAISMWQEMLRQLVVRNDEYQVIVDSSVKHGFGPAVRVTYLSIKRRDKQPIHDWRDLQAIKNMLCGPEFEAIELYPAESRLLDAANQYHLFVFAMPDGKPLPVPVGFTGVRGVGGAREAAKVGAVQRPMENENG